MKLNSGADILKAADSGYGSIPEVMIAYESDNEEISRDAIMERLSALWQAMAKSTREAFERPASIDLKITSNDALKLYGTIQSGAKLDGLYARAMCYALSVSAVNASMGRVAACPTGGSCGVVPGCLVAVCEHLGYGEAEASRALLTASAVGLIISENATLAGALGGCQAEIGTAAAMAASAVCELYHASAAVCLNAGAIALKSLMGLVCDPVASLVESPCTKRNATAATVALACAEMSMAGIESIIPFDEVVEAMNSVGKQIPAALRETSEGGIAKTRTAQRLQREVFGNLPGSKKGE